MQSAEAVALVLQGKESPLYDPTRDICGVGQSMNSQSHDLMWFVACVTSVAKEEYAFRCIFQHDYLLGER